MTDDTDTTDDATEESPVDGAPDDGETPAANDDDAGGPTAEGAADGGAVELPADDADGPTDDAAVGEYLMKGALVMLVVLGVVATLQFYLSAQAAIADLTSDQFRDAFKAAFNLVVLLAVLIGIAQVFRRLG